MRKTIIGIIIGGIIFGTTGVLAANYLYKASDIEYEPQDEEWDTNNVQSAISDLYNLAGSNSPAEFIIATYAGGNYGFDKNGIKTTSTEGVYRDGDKTNEMPLPECISSWVISNTSSSYATVTATLAKEGYYSWFFTIYNATNYTPNMSPTHHSIGDNITASVGVNPGLMIIVYWGEDNPSE